MCCLTKTKLRILILFFRIRFYRVCKLFVRKKDGEGRILSLFSGHEILLPTFLKET